MLQFAVHTLFSVLNVLPECVCSFLFGWGFFVWLGFFWYHNVQNMLWFRSKALSPHFYSVHKA